LTLNTRLCLGLDPRAAAYEGIGHLRAHTLEVLTACAEFVACVKPQLAFYEALGVPGFEVLEEVCARARSLGLPVLLDAKRGDVGSTAEAYADAWLSGVHAGDALAVNPYLGWETLIPFVSVARANGGAVFVLVKTSNPGSRDLQGSGTAEKVAAEVARLGAEESGLLSSVGAVVGATHPGELGAWRELMPRATPLLPGLGVQGGRPEDQWPGRAGQRNRSSRLA
jgi:orotidine-5'-phosphate decarboxylase